MLRFGLTLLGLILTLPSCFVLFEENSPPPTIRVTGPDVLHAFGQPDADFGSDISTIGTKKDVFQPDAPMTNRNPATFPNMQGEMAIGNATGAQLTVRVRGLKPTVKLDCAMVGKAPQVLLARALLHQRPLGSSTAVARLALAAAVARAQRFWSMAAVWRCGSCSGLVQTTRRRCCPALWPQQYRSPVETATR